MQPQGQTQPVAPAGGFKLGGWYNGMQWNGSSFGAPNVITVGNASGQTVNPAVVAAGNIAQGLKPGTNEAYLASQGASVGGTPGTSGGTGTTTPESDALTKQISDIQNKINDRTTAFNTATTNINDNPFYSEATRVGKIKSLNAQYNADLVPLNSQLKTYQSSLDTQTKAATAANKTTVHTFTDNAGNVTATVIDANGNVVNQTSLGTVGKGKTASKTGTTKLTSGDKQALVGGVASDARDGHTLQEITNYYKALGLTEAEIYQTYNQNSVYGPAQETLTQVKQGQYITNQNQAPAPTSSPTSGIPRSNAA